MFVAVHLPGIIFLPLKQRQMKQTYSEKLRDPRWQKLRLSVLERDSFKCTLCGDKETELHVHHEEYSGDPWEADFEKLKTLCKHCHRLIESLKNLNLLQYKILKKKYDNYYLIYLFSQYQEKKAILIIKIPNETQEPEFVTGLHSDLIESFYDFIHHK
jgi:hypothetical protein